jgi:hypothetical protein
MDLVAIFLTVALVLAVASIPVSIFVVVRYAHVGGTTAELAKAQIALAEVKAKNEMDLAERKLCMDERRFEQEQAERAATFEARRTIMARNIER